MRVDLGVDIERLSGLLAGVQLLMGERAVIGQGAGGSACFADITPPYNRQLVYVASVRLWDHMCYCHVMSCHAFPMSRRKRILHPEDWNRAVRHALKKVLPDCSA